MLDHIAVSTSLSSRTHQLIAEAAAWRAWAASTQAQMQHTIEASERMLRDDRLRSFRSGCFGLPMVPERR